MPLKNEVVFLVLGDTYKGNKTLLKKVGQFDTLEEAEKEAGFIVTSELEVGDYNYYVVKAHRIFQGRVDNAIEEDD